MNHVLFATYQINCCLFICKLLTGVDLFRNIGHKGMVVIFAKKQEKIWKWKKANTFVSLKFVLVILMLGF
jgi:hypothetical protein